MLLPQGGISMTGNAQFTPREANGLSMTANSAAAGSRAGKLSSEIGAPGWRGLYTAWEKVFTRRHAGARSEGFVASTARFAIFHTGYLTIRPKAILGVDAPTDAAVGAGDRGFRFSFDKHPLGAQQPATHIGKLRLRSGFRHNHTSPFIARNNARLTATRASWTL